MKSVNSVETGKTPSGRFKVYVWGQPNYHIMDWRGCNYRYKAVPGQPHRGWETRKEAEEWARTQFENVAQARGWAYFNAGDGTFMTDDKFADLDLQPVPGLGAGDD